MLSVSWVGGARKFQLTPIGGEDKVQRGQLQHTLHSRHGQTAEPDLGWLNENTHTFDCNHKLRQTGQRQHMYEKLLGSFQKL